jgi:diguanylate cyclase (GGDEF)-like protein/PAS domain S-box-containing protein
VILARNYKSIYIKINSCGCSEGFCPKNGRGQTAGATNPLKASQPPYFLMMNVMHSLFLRTLALAGLLGAMVANAGAAQTLAITAEERAWLKNHPVIRVGIDRDFAPYEWIDEKGHYVGLSADYVALVECRLGVKFVVVKNRQWAEILGMARRGELDMLADANKTPERELYLSFTEPYFSNPLIIINHRKNGFVGDLGHLDGKQVSVENGYFIIGLLQHNYPDIRLLLADSQKQALLNVANGKADAHIGDGASANYLFKQEGLVDLRYAGETGYRSHHRMAATKNHPELASLLDKALADITPAEKETIKNKWLGLQPEAGLPWATLLYYGFGLLSLIILAAGWNLYDISRRKAAENVRKQAYLLLQTVIDTIPLRIFWKDRQSRYLGCNTLFANDAGFSFAADIIGKSDDMLGWQTQNWQEHADDFNIMATGAAKLSFEDPQNTADGKNIWLRTSKVPLYDENHAVIGVLGVYEDITEYKSTQEKLALSANVFAYSRDAILITDAQANIIDVNQAFCDITGYTRAEVWGKNPKLLSSGRQDQAFYAAMWQAIAEQGYWSGEVWNRKKNGEMYVEWLNISMVTNAQHQLTHYIGIFSDITPIKAQEQQLKFMAHYDVLTGIPNRALFADRLHLALVQSQRQDTLLVVGYIDLDGFKLVNDSLGHHAGDELLVEIAERIKNILREGDTVARLGGDEFAFLLLGLNEVEECDFVLRRLLDVVSMPVALENIHTVSVSASIGVSIYPIDNSDAETLLRHADQAMYKIKQGNKNDYKIYDAVLNRQLHKQRIQLNRIAQALENGEFVLFFQPKVDMRQGIIFGAEALIRWQHPQRGLLAPGDFLPLANGHDIIAKIDDWVINTALAQMERWRGEGLPLAISANVSARSLQKTGFVQQLQQALVKHPIVSPQYFELEILETEALHDSMATSQVIRQCQQLGIKFAIDDFGTGYSSLSYLKSLPAETLKIDQSFVRDMLVDNDSLAIIRGIIGLAQAFNREVVAEGMESAEHGSVLLEMGCRYGQGYYIAHPMPAIAVAAWVENWRPPDIWKQSKHHQDSIGIILT